jgi:septum site-determining protein MinD
MILAVAGGKGGVGTSTVALNLAAELDAVAVDADLSMADLPRGRGPDLHDVLAGRADPVEAVDDGGPVAVLPCGRSLARARACDPTRFGDAVEAVAAACGDVVLDCPAGASAGAGVPLAVADSCVIVTTPGDAARRDATRVRALARDLDAGLARVALNRGGGDPNCERVRENLGAPVVAIPDDGRVAAAWRAGHPVRSVAPDSLACRRIQRLASAVNSCRSE